MRNEEKPYRKWLVDLQDLFFVVCTGNDVKAQTSLGKSPVNFLNLFSGQRASSLHNDNIPGERPGRHTHTRPHTFIRPTDDSRCFLNG